MNTGRLSNLRLDLLLLLYSDCRFFFQPLLRCDYVENKSFPTRSFIGLLICMFMPFDNHQTQDGSIIRSTCLSLPGQETEIHLLLKETNALSSVVLILFVILLLIFLYLPVLLLFYYYWDGQIENICFLSNVVFLWC